MDNLKIDGIFTMNIFKLINGKKCLIDKYSDSNLVVGTGKMSLCQLLANGSNDYIVNKIAFGEGTSTPNNNDIDLTNYFRKNIIDYSFDGSSIVVFNWELLATEANGLSITEYGLYTDGDFLFARKIRNEIQKTVDIIIEGTWKIIFTT